MLTEFTVHLLSYWLMHFLAWFIGIFICTFNSQREGTHFLPYIMLKAAGFHVITTATEIELIGSFKKRSVIAVIIQKLLQGCGNLNNSCKEH